MKEKAQAAHARAFLQSTATSRLLRTTQPTRLGMDGQQLRTDDNDDDVGGRAYGATAGVD